ncbi:putative Uncharacterized isochorismatase family protein yddQ [Glarea lozoyensis 74030]|uniref:Putative Uncharacterized isochorismatase family protein yddQ n=1 Tax=Glarea lozoyensis (strain ATCC 74030 / MF5533) TaxID=1104152 RepID=H0ES21_GLAL7|nr:putative Uncharacterized isochorismatase family protein yddQ [Glarea lozoyensis 74030]
MATIFHSWPHSSTLCTALLAFSFRNDVLGAPRSSASTSDSVLVIIDAQNEYANGKLAVKNVEQSRKVIGSLLNKYRKANGKVVHVLHQVPDGAPVFTPGSDLAKEFDELKPKDGEPVSLIVYRMMSAD